MAKANLMKKIVIFVPAFPVLSETFIQRDIVRLVNSGKLDISIVSMEKGKAQIDPVLQKFTHVKPLTWINALFALSFFVLKPKKVFTTLQLAIGDTTKSAAGRIYLWLKSIGYAQIFKKFKPNEIHAHFLSDPSTIAMLAGLLLDIPYSISAHARDVTEYPTLAVLKISTAKFVTLCNNNAYNACVKLASNQHETLHLIRHCVTPEDIYSFKPANTKPNRPLIYSGGVRLEEKKGLEYLIRASKILKDRGIDHEVVITGGGTQYEFLQSLISELGLKSTVFIYGGHKGVPFETIAGYYQIADIVALPCVNLDSGDADGIPNALIEAAHARLPIVTTNAGSITELVVHNQSGIIVNQREAELLATTIEQLIFDSEKRRYLGENASSRAAELFNPQATVRQLEALLLL